MSKFIFIVFFAASLQLSVCAQEDVKAKHAAYNLCIVNMEKEPQRAFGYCSDYLGKYPNDDKRLTDFAKGWLTAYEKISRYLASIKDYSVSDPNQSWSIYSPDLAKQVPIIKETDGSYKIEILRQYVTSFEHQLLSKAEAVYPNPKDVPNEFFAHWRYLSNTNADLPSGEPKWWSGTSNSILSTNIVTTSAVLYYYDISRKLRVDNKQNFGGHRLVSSELKYQSSIKKFAKYEHGGKSFSNVYVADMNLTWGWMCGGLCGEGFTRNKIVVLSEKGDVLEMFLDASVNNTHWVS